MKLVLGGYAQGKLDYVLRQEWARGGRVWEGRLPGPEERRQQPAVIHDFQEWVRETLRAGGDPEAEISDFLRACPECVIICDEVGSGIVPADAFEREYRERLGRIQIGLAGQAEEVVRVLCGLGQKIK